MLIFPNTLKHNNENEIPILSEEQKFKGLKIPNLGQHMESGHSDTFLKYNLIEPFWSANISMNIIFDHFHFSDCNFTIFIEVSNNVFKDFHYSVVCNISILEKLNE